MYKQIIERVTKDVVLRQTQEDFKKLVVSKLAGCRLYNGIHTASLRQLKDRPDKFRVVINKGLEPKERLIGFVHEILHIFYMVPDLPLNEEELISKSKEDFWFLEDTIEELACRMVKTEENFWREMFERSFGFPFDISPVEMK